MRTLRYLVLLGFFAAVGVALAIGLAVSTTPPAVGERAGASLLAGRSPGAEDRATPVSPTEYLQLAAPESARTTDSDSFRPSAVAPSGPLLAEPYPPQAQQFIPPLSKQRLEKIYEYMQKQIGPGADSSAPESVPAPPAESGARSTTAAEAAPPGAGAARPPAAAEKSNHSSGSVTPVNQITKSSTNGEGDGQLSIHIQDADIREVLDSLGEQGNLNILASKNVQGKVSATLKGVDVDSALGAILKSTGYVAKREGKFIYVGTPEDFDTLEQSLDKIGTRVYRPNYVTAKDLQVLIQPLVTEKAGVVSVSSPSEVGIAPDSTNGGGNKFAGGDVVLVRDYEAVLAQIDQIVAEIDVRPMQVAIEAMILSVQLDDQNQFGVDFQLLRDKANVKFGLGSPPQSLLNFSFEDGGLKFGFLDSSLGAFLEALESIGDTNVIATPRLTVLNKHRAEILIGEQLGYVSTTITETSSSQSVSFLDVGAQLRLRPFISTDGLIRMEVHPELSTGSVETKAGFTLPKKKLTQVTTNVMVRDGCTVIIGGLMREEMETTATQIPLLGDLPLVGVVFRNKSETTSRREILILITPHIVYEPETCEEGDAAACEFHRRQAVYAEKMSPIGKRSIARRYFRMAQNAWAAGDRDRALRFAEMAVHFDPLSREAIDLRSNIWQGQPYGDHTLAGSAPAAPSAELLDGEAIPDWLLNDLEREPSVQPAPNHPLDPGQTGSHRDVSRPRRLQ